MERRESEVGVDVNVISEGSVVRSVYMRVGVGVWLYDMMLMMCDEDML